MHSTDHRLLHLRQVLDERFSDLNIAYDHLRQLQTGQWTAQCTACRDNAELQGTDVGAVVLSSQREEIYNKEDFDRD
jgi:hypothetical protein